MVIQSLRFSDLCWCFLLQHFFAKLQDKVDQKRFVRLCTAAQVHSRIPSATGPRETALVRGASIFV